MPTPNEATGIHITHSAEETRSLGARLAQSMVPGSAVFLYGDLGSGKTTFVQGMCQGLDVEGWANSPTFTIINEYRGRLPVYHCDFYRLTDAEELDNLALDEVLYGIGVAVIEWPEIVEEWAPANAVRIRFTRLGPRTRRVVFEGLDSESTPPL
jgi:tRNA threonylcarbamoyladenosine biosynthesis protein TsaE